MQDNASFLKNSADVLAENSDYSWLSSISPECIENLHKLCDEVHQSLLGGPLFSYEKSDWERAIERFGIDRMHIRYAQRSELAGMLTVQTAEGVHRHCEVLLGLTHAVVHNSDKGSFLTKMFYDPSDGIEENCKRVRLAFLELVDTRYRNSHPLPWDRNFPLAILNAI